uniref:GRIP domain-containing protein n=1 Tax=Steinernema glaseri TaxID=37863 RepID=A0A1I7ZVR3_9BILA
MNSEEGPPPVSHGEPQASGYDVLPENDAPPASSLANIHISSDSDSSDCIADGPTISVNKLSTLYEKYNILCKEVDRLESENGDYRERLLKALRERDQIEETLKASGIEHISKTSEYERKLLEYEYQLKTLRDRSSAQETQFKNMTADLTEKMNNSISQLNKKLAASEKEKNDAVIKYAMREAEVMRMKESASKQADELRLVKEERDTLRQSSSQKALEEMTKTEERLRAELSNAASEAADLKNKLKLSEARIEAGQSTIITLKKEMDTLKKQVSRLSEERDAVKDDHRHLMSQLQKFEQQSASDKAEARKFHENKEELYKSVLNEMARLREENQSYVKQLEEETQARADTQAKIEKLEEETSSMKQELISKTDELKRLQEIETQVNESSERACKATKACEEAQQERDQAEREASECRKQAERMLEITERLTQKNADVSAELEAARAKNLDLSKKLVEYEMTECAIKSRNESLKKDLDEAVSASSTELSSLKRELEENSSKVKQLTATVQELQSENAVIKKKNTSYIKELKSEVNSLRKQLAAQPAIEVRSPSDGSPVLNTNSLSEPKIGLESSRASSITSIELLGRNQGDGMGRNLEAASKASSASGQSTGPQLSMSSQPTDDNVQQVMIEKIVKLQRQLARRQEKIEFLEDHINQCIEELQNKTKIIQSYALREEASLLLPADDTLDKVPLARKGTSHTLFGSAFSYGSDKKTSVDLATEINSRLQAVLEDTLLKNITLKKNVDTLGEEISRLSRENRQMSLMK